VYDLIIVPGGGLCADGTLHPWVKLRFDRALEIRQNEPILCLSAGTPYKAPPQGESGLSIFEAVSGARYLLAQGLDPASILMETASWDTIGNAYFARVMHTEVRDWRRLLVVNSAFHMERTELIFRWVFSLAPERGYQMRFEAVPDTGFPEPDLQYRRKHEQARLVNAHALRDRIRNMADLHNFLFTEHDAYSAAGLMKVRGPVPEELVRAY
jgi:hypothetical protein